MDLDWFLEPFGNVVRFDVLPRQPEYLKPHRWSKAVWDYGASVEVTCLDCGLMADGLTLQFMKHDKGWSWCRPAHNPPNQGPDGQKEGE